MNKSLILRVAVPCLAMGCSLMSGPSVAVDGSQGPGKLTAQDVTDALAAVSSGDFRRFSGFASSDGVVVARRHVDWDKTAGKNSNGDGPKVIEEPKNGTYLFLGGLRATVWVEDDVRFRTDQLSGAGFRQVLTQFARYVKVAQASYPRSVISSQSLADAWNTRSLPDSVTGKIASNTYWYISFVKERSAYKIRRMEFAVD